MDSDSEWWTPLAVACHLPVLRVCVGGGGFLCFAADSSSRAQGSVAVPSRGMLHRAASAAIKQPVSLCACVRACVRVSVFLCVRASVRAYMRACFRACVRVRAACVPVSVFVCSCVRAFVCAYVRAYVRECMCVSVSVSVCLCVCVWKCDDQASLESPSRASHPTNLCLSVCLSVCLTAIRLYCVCVSLRACVCACVCVCVCVARSSVSRERVSRGVEERPSRRDSSTPPR